MDLKAAGVVVVVREKGYDPNKKMKRFLARHVGEGKFVNTATGEIFTLGNNLEVE